MEAERFITIDGERLYCHVQGSGNPVLLVHGLGLSSYTWRRNIEALSQNFTVYAPDLRGFGKSDKPDKRGYSLDHHRRMLKKLLDYFDLRKIDYIGSSMGGEIGLRLAMTNPERIKRLVLIASSGYRDEFPRVLRWLSHLPCSLIEPWVRRRILTEPAIRSSIMGAYYRENAVSEEEIQAMAAPVLEKGSPRAYLRLLREFDFGREKANYAHIMHPALILAGSHDIVIPLEHLRRLHRELPNSKLVVIPESGHMLHEEKWQDVNQLILNFLM
jgi:pimeloyl-ACP methyl ester carboxylesterase